MEVMEPVTLAAYAASCGHQQQAGSASTALFAGGAVSHRQAK